MANKTINQLTNLGSVDASDEFVVYDVSTNETKKVTKSNLLSGMQTTLTFDDTPTNGSSNPVTSGGVYNALDSKIDLENEAGAKISSANSAIQCRSSTLASINIYDATKTGISIDFDYGNGIIRVYSLQNGVTIGSKTATLS